MTLTKKTGLIGYSYVIGFKELTVCNSGQVYDVGSSSCKAYTASNCLVSSDNTTICSVCDTKAEFLHKDANCYSICPLGFFNDTYLKQCRPCDSTCYTCSAKLVNNCLSCTGLLYLVKSLNICVNNCEQYGLTKSVSISNVCVPCIIYLYKLI